MVRAGRRVGLYRHVAALARMGFDRRIRERVGTMTVYGHPKFGATKRFTHGKLNKSDKGELQFGVSVTGSVIRIDFGKEVSWMGLYAEHARAFAKALLDAADQAEKGGRA